MREDWAEKLKRKLEGHRKSPPSGLWEGICKEMGFEAEPVHQKPAVIKRWWAAAAAVLALVGSFVFYNSHDIEQPQLADAVFQQPTSEKLIAEKPAAETQTTEGPTTEQPASKQLAAKSKKQARNSGIAMNQVTSLPDSHADEPEQAPTAEEEEKPTEHEQTEHTELKLRAENPDHHRSALPLGSSKNYPQSTIHPHSNKWSLGVNASSGLLAANTSQQMARLYYNDGEMVYYSDKNDLQSQPENGSYSSHIPSYTLTEYVSEHHLPIRFGLSLNFQLTPRIALHSGISYTYLYSEFSIPLLGQANYDQKLHYLGIPLGVSWQFWKTDHFLFYLSGGAMLEKCVSAEVNGNSVNKNPWQWSVDAKAGAEYDFNRHLGFYLEPSLGYYFDDGTPLEHYYKKHPLTPTIEFGFRLHLNK